MTKIVTKLPISAECLEDLRTSALKKMISEEVAKLKENLDELKEVAEEDFVMIENKKVWFDRNNAAIYPKFEEFNLPKFMTSGQPSKNYSVNFEGFTFVAMTPAECQKSFRRGCGNPYQYNDGDFDLFPIRPHLILTNELISGGGVKFFNTVDNAFGTWNDSDEITLVPICRFNGKNSPKLKFTETLKIWIKNDLIPEGLSAKTENLFTKYKDYLEVKDEEIFWDEEKILSAALNGTEFDFLAEAKNLFAATEFNATEDFFNDLKNELLNGDKVRAEIDPYDENILSDPNRGHWDLWDYGTDKEKTGEIILPEGLTARNPADDINHGIVAIDFGTKSTVVVYENERLQIFPLQVDSGKYGNGINAKNYENPTVIQFINLKNFVEAYKARAGRPKTKWNDVTVSHTAFDNLTNSDSKHYYSFLTELKNWCGSNNRIKIKDRNEITEDLPPFMEILDNDINPLEYYAYYLGLYINNMLQEKRIFLKYIMSFPVTYDKGIRERMRRIFARGLKKSLPTALLSNEEAMKNFSVQEGVSEPAAYAVTALQEYNFDPEGDEENYYAVFDFGGGTTDFDFGVFRESEKDRYDYSLIHFGENGDKTLGGENLLKLLAFEVFKANQDKLLNPGDKSVGKIPFTFATDKKDFVGSAALIKDSQEAHLNMHNLIEKLRPVWEDPESEEAKKILEGNSGIEVELFTDNGNHLTNFVLHTVFENYSLDLKKILRDRIEQGIKNFFIAMREAFYQGNNYEDYEIKMPCEIDEISIFLAGNSSKSKLVEEIFNEYINFKDINLENNEFPFDNEGILKFGYSLKDGYLIKDTADGKCLYKVTKAGEKLVGLISNPENRDQIISAVSKWEKPKDRENAKLLNILELKEEEMPKFVIYPALGSKSAQELRKKRGIKFDENDIAAPTGKTGVAFGLLKCRDSGNIEITHITPTENKTSFQFYIGRNKKRKFKTVIDKNTKFEKWYEFIDAGNNFDILYSDLPEAISNEMDVTKAKRINVTLDQKDPALKVFIRAVKSDTIEYTVASSLEDLIKTENLPEPLTIKLE